jgi:REP element-mobilizing transposase RayT
MSTGYQITDQEGLYYLTFQIVDWIDIFTRQVYRDIVIDSLKYAIDNKELQVFAFVIMSNHVHLIAQSSTGKLSAMSRSLPAKALLAQYKPYLKVAVIGC